MNRTQINVVPPIFPVLLANTEHSKHVTCAHDLAY